MLTVLPFSTAGATLSQNQGVVLDSSLLVPFVDPECKPYEFTQALAFANDATRADALMAMTMKTREELEMTIMRVIAGRTPEIRKFNLANDPTIGKKLFLSFDAMNSFLIDNFSFWPEPLGKTDPETLQRAEELVLNEAVELPDALIVAQAEKEGFSIIASMDGDYLRIKGANLTIYVPDYIYRKHRNGSMASSTAGTGAVPDTSGQA